MEIFMENNDTINLLRECNAGVKMGVSSIDEVLDNVKNDELKAILISSKERHEDLGNDTRQLLNKYDESGKEPNPMAKSMSWIKTNVMLAMEDSDHTIADLMTDGCNMGVKSLNRYLNKYQAADISAKNIAEKLIKIEENLTDDIKCYL